MVSAVLYDKGVLEMQNGRNGNLVDYDFEKGFNALEKRMQSTKSKCRIFSGALSSRVFRLEHEHLLKLYNFSKSENFETGLVGLFRDIENVGNGNHCWDANEAVYVVGDEKPTSQTDRWLQFGNISVEKIKDKFQMTAKERCSKDNYLELDAKTLAHGFELFERYIGYVNGLHSNTLDDFISFR